MKWRSMFIRPTEIGLVVCYSSILLHWDSNKITHCSQMAICIFNYCMVGNDLYSSYQYIQFYPNGYANGICLCLLLTIISLQFYPFLNVLSH